MEKLKEEQLVEALNSFSFDSGIIDKHQYGNGHINDTFLLTFNNGSKAILQRMNSNVFKKPNEVIENIIHVTNFLREKIIINKGDPERETLNLIPATNGNLYYVDSIGDYWRVYRFIENAKTYDVVESPSMFHESAFAFGNFQRLLSDYPAANLHETIKGFHDTRARFLTFKNAVKEDKFDRAKNIKEEIEFVLKREPLASCFSETQDKGELPLRVTHNDTKLNNVMIDNATGKAICVIDLDTVMPGLAMNDFGDSIRFGANTGEEDERDLSKVSLDMDLFGIYAKGFIEGCGKGLTEKEILLFPMGAKMMTFECGMRFLTDYLQGDIYFRIHRENHNLDRARCQFKLLEDMELKWDRMNGVIRKLIEK